jgi:hypothetical protein
MDRDILEAFREVELKDALVNVIMSTMIKKFGGQRLTKVQIGTITEPGFVGSEALKVMCPEEDWTDENAQE